MKKLPLIDTSLFRRSKMKKFGNIICGSLLLLWAISLYNASLGISKLSGVSRIGSGFMPQLVAILLAIVSIVIIAGEIKKLKTPARAVPKADTAKVNLKAVVATLFLIMVYVALLEKVGFLIMTAVYLFIQISLLSGKEDRKISLFGVIAVTASVAIYYLFVNAFHLMLPVGILG
jgi:putative tricarboxylic transport membrane protein